MSGDGEKESKENTTEEKNEGEEARLAYKLRRKLKEELGLTKQEPIPEVDIDIQTQILNGSMKGKENKEKEERVDRGSIRGSSELTGGEGFPKKRREMTMGGIGVKASFTHKFQKMKKERESVNIGEEEGERVGSWREEEMKDLHVFRKVGVAFYRSVETHFGWYEPGISDFCKVCCCVSLF